MDVRHLTATIILIVIMTKFVYKVELDKEHVSMLAKEVNVVRTPFVLLKSTVLHVFVKTDLLVIPVTPEMAARKKREKTGAVKIRIAMEVVFAKLTSREFENAQTHV